MGKCIKCDSKIELTRGDRNLRRTLRGTSKMISRLYPAISEILKDEKEYGNDCLKVEINQIAKGIIK